jgi:predicted 3-demethylubiquinone-9 3-methyltransferase (glyoxalase superfamily)
MWQVGTTARETVDTRRELAMAKIDPFLWFQKDCAEAVNFYVSTFEDAEILSTTYAQEGVPGIEAGDVMTIEFSLFDQRFIALNGGPNEGFDFTGAISFVVNCDTQEEVDHYWDTLSEGGRPDACGWLADRFGVWWQVVPRVLDEMLSDDDPARVQRVMQVMLKMNKLEIKPLVDAYNQA